MRAMESRGILTILGRLARSSVSRMENSFVSFADETVGVVWDAVNNFGRILQILCQKLFDIAIFPLI